MNSQNIFDVVLYLLNEDIFKKVLQAEIKYLSVKYPFLSGHQVRGKALGVMGIKSSFGEMPKVSKLLPLIYKRKIQEPTQTWICQYIERIFQPVISLAVKINCVKKNECSLKTLKFPNLSKNKNFDYTDYDEIFDEERDNTGSVTENILHTNEKISIYKTKIIINKTCPKSSESNATIMWPFQSTPPLHEKNELREPKRHSAISKHYLRFNFSNVKKIRGKKYLKQSKNVENSDKPKKLTKINSNKENYESQKRIVHDRVNHNNVLLPIPEHTILREKSTSNEMGFLTDMFTPAIRKRMFPDNVIPIIKYRSPTSVTREEF